MIGTRLGHYQVVEKLGEGGMGVVYRATDATLERSVAVKVLPQSFASDPDRLARFEREAKLLASLNHPNIAHVYGFERATLEDGTTAHFLAMELVEGEDLSDRIRRGPIPLEEALAIAKQMAEALEDAHEHGIVHRDLKPGNIKVTPDGKVKVLDFGLAKAYSGDGAGSSSPDLSQSPTLAYTGTQAGVILGTAAYMSPEQARGRPVDKRTDIWAFGVVLYEMLTGRSLFTGDTVSDVLAGVLKSDVDLAALPGTTPLAIRDLLRRCLERDPKRRLRDIGEARLALEGTDAAWPMPERARRSLGPSIAALALAVIAFLAGWLLRPSVPEVVRKVDISDEQMKTDDDFAPVLSPNGARVLYVAGDRLRVRELDQAEATTVAGTEGAKRAFWSPDGREIGFFRNAALYRVALDGGVPQLIAQTGPTVGGAGACWGPDGQIVYSLGNTGLFELSARGGEPRVLLAPDPAKGEDHFHGCAFLPGSRAIVYVIHARDQPPNTLALFENGRSRVLLKEPADTLGDPGFSPSGHIVFGRRGEQEGVWALPFSLSRLEPTGKPFLIVPGATSPSVAADGSLLFAPARPARPTRLVWISYSGQRGDAAVAFPDQVMGIALSRAGNRVAAAVVSAGGSDVWVADLERGSRTRLTFGPGSAEAPAWSPDGTRIAFEQNNQILIVPADGSSKARVVGPGLQPSFSEDGRSILAHRPHIESPRSLYEIVSLDAAGSDTPRVVLSDSVSVRYPLLSPDGHLLAFDRGDGDDVASFLTRFPEVKERWQVSAVGGTFLRWSPDGKRLYYFAPAPGTAEESLVEVDVRVGQTVSLGVPRPLFTLASAGVAAAEYEVDPTGDRFLMISRDQGDSLTRLVLVQHWFADFQ